MKTTQIRQHLVCATAAVLLTGLSSTVFVSAEPRTLERRVIAASARAPGVHSATVEHAAQTPVVKFRAG
jgi:hypothetical protein